MSDHMNPSPAEPPSKSGYETTDVNPFAIGLFALALILMIALVLPFLNWIFWRFEAAAKSADRPQSSVSIKSTFSGPRLQDQPAVDLAEFRDDEDRRLSSYGWVDQQQGIVRIPIERAIKVLAERGFPRLNLLSWYIYVLGGLFTLYALLAGGVDTGWTFYAPYSSTYSNTYVMATAVGIFITGFSSILTGLNFIVTIHKMRALGLTWFRLPLFIWSIYATSIIMVLGTPVLAISMFLVGLERMLGIGIFDPRLGGDPILFQHLFWFYSHPAVYIMILPSMGVISEIIPCYCRKRPFGYEFIGFSSFAIAVFSFLVWGHHLFVSGQSIYAGMVFSMLSYMVAIPSAVKVFTLNG